VFYYFYTDLLITNCCTIIFLYPKYFGSNHPTIIRGHNFSDNQQHTTVQRQICCTLLVVGKIVPPDDGLMIAVEACWREKK
jgi:hypothetical protein